MAKKQAINIAYNTTQKPILLKEFGRNMQNLIQYACKLKDRAERNKVANQIVDLMVHFNPEFKNKEDHINKIWDYIFIMSDFKLEVDSPFPKPTRALINLKPEKVDYGIHKISFKHYGHTVELMIEKAIAMENGSPEKETLVHYIACLMKMYYKIWNKENIPDSVIVEQLGYLSDNQLEIDPLKYNMDVLYEKIGKNEEKEERRSSTYTKPRKTNNYQQNSTYQNRNNQNNYSNRNNNYQQNRYPRNNQGNTDSRPNNNQGNTDSRPYNNNNQSNYNKPMFRRRTNRPGHSSSSDSKPRRPNTDSRPSDDLKF